MRWMLMPLRRYADFDGQSRRQEYWLFVLGKWIVIAALFALFVVLLPENAGALGLPIRDGAPMGVLVLGTVFILAMVIPTLAVQVRRFHDQDKSGWMCLTQFVPAVGGIILLVFMCLEGTRGPNRFGPDPVPENLADMFR